MWEDDTNLVGYAQPPKPPAARLRCTHPTLGTGRCLAALMVRESHHERAGAPLALRLSKGERHLRSSPRITGIQVRRAPARDRLLLPAKGSPAKNSVGLRIDAYRGRDYTGARKQKGPNAVLHKLLVFDITESIQERRATMCKTCAAHNPGKPKEAGKPKK